jgi:hypothetical protein
VLSYLSRVGDDDVGVDGGCVVLRVRAATATRYTTVMFREKTTTVLFF